MEELLAFVLALFARNVGRRSRAAALARAAKTTPAKAPPVNRLVETLTSIPQALPPPAPALALAVPENFAADDLSFIDEERVRPRRRDPIGTLAMLRSSRGLLGAIVASEILAPPLGIRNDSRGS